MKKHRLFTSAIALVLLAVICLAPVYSAADKYPNKPIRILVTKSIGGSVDSAIRLVAPFLEKELGVPVVVENQTSGGGRVASAAVAKAAPDGYTLLATPLPSAIVGEVMYDGKVDFEKMTAVYNVMQTFQTITVAYNSPVNSFKDLLELSKTKRLTLAGSGGMGSNASIIFAKLRKFGMTNLAMVPFPGASETAAAVMGGHCDLSSQSTDGVLTYVENKTLKVLAVCSPKRISFLPNVPTFKELGFDFVVPLTSSVFGPPEMSRTIVKTLETAFKKVMTNPELETMRARMNVALYPLNATELRKLVKDNTKMVYDILPLLKEEAAGTAGK